METQSYDVFFKHFFHQLRTLFGKTTHRSVTMDDMLLLEKIGPGRTTKRTRILFYPLVDDDKKTGAFPTKMSGSKTSINSTYRTTEHVFSFPLTRDQPSHVQTCQSRWE